MTKKEHRESDADIALFERLQREVPALLRRADAEIAARCEEQFGISAEDVLIQLGREVMMAHDPHFFGG
jgi:hypothetical protein